MTIKHRRGGHGGDHTMDTHLPLVRKEARDGVEVRPYKPKSRQRIKVLAMYARYLSYAISVLIVILVLILRFDTNDRVRHKVVNLKNRVMGNSQKYAEESTVASLLEAVKKPAVNGQYYGVFCTVSNLESDETHIAFGKSSLSPAAALKIAQSKLPHKTNKYPYVKIDVVTGVMTFNDYNYYEEFNKKPSRWFGIALDWESDWVFHAEEVHNNALVDRHRFIRWERLALYAAKTGRTDGGLALPDYGDDATTIDRIHIFHTESVFVDMTTKEQYRLFHGHRLYDEEMVTLKLLTDRAKDASAYLAQLVKDSGRQVYRYNPRSDYEPFGYNINRHAGTLYAMARVFKMWPDGQLHQSMERTLGYLKQSIQDCPLPLKPETTAKCVVDFETEEKIKVANLGASALTILAIVEYIDAVKPDDASDLLVLVSSIADYIEGSLYTNSGDDHPFDGSLVHKVRLSKDNELLGIEKDFFVRYFQGQVAFCLARMTVLAQENKWTTLFNKKPSWMKTAQAAASFMVKEDAKEEDDAEFTFDHWLLYGIAEIEAAAGSSNGHREELPEGFLKHVVRSVQVVGKYQNGVPDEKRDFDDMDRLGIYYDDLSSAATATKTEGLCAVIDLLRKNGEDWKLAFGTASLSLRYQLQTQYQPEEAMYMRLPLRILGGFHNSVLSTDLRNDYTQHNLCSLICMAHALEKKGAKLF